MLRTSMQAVRSWVTQHPRWAAAIAAFAVIDFAYASYRAAFLSACDLVHGYLEPTRAIVNGQDPYAVFQFNSYSPFFYAVFAPLSVLPDWAASVAWSLISLGALFGACVFTRGFIGRPARSMLWPLGLAAAFIVDNVNLGQSNLFALFFVCAAIYALYVRREVSAGVLLAVAIAWKLTPAIFVGLLVLRRQFRALAGVVLGLALCLVAAPSVAFGPARATAMLQGWSTLVLEPFARGEKGRTTNIDWYHTNQSMEAALQRALTSYGGDRYGGLHALTDPAFLDEGQVHALSTAARLLLLLALAAIVLRTGRGRRSLGRQAALFLLAALFISPASWFSHYVAAVVAYAVAVELEDRHVRRALAIVGVLTALSLGSYVRSHSLVFVGHALLFIAIWRAAWASARDQVITRVKTKNTVAATAATAPPTVPKSAAAR